MKDELGRTSNIVGEYAEHLVKDYVGGELLPPSNKSADVKAKDGRLYQVKSRKVKGKLTGSLGIIRSWGFDYLTVILFDEYGGVLYAISSPKKVAKEYAKSNDLQNGDVISITQDFINDIRNINITNAIMKINLQEVDESVFEIKEEILKIPIGKYVRLKLNEVLGKELINEEELKKMQDLEYSKFTFGIQFPFFKSVKSIEEVKVSRYWKEPVTVLDEKYFVCSEWYEREGNNDRPYFEEWLSKIVK
ncbi:hypothetical protein LPB136_07090 [Tenacibaculum todarodis]|uniref:Uncharacterized protein n=2 Tax=Tenacibaculum todarodis TaxID=1850252 RepID=A0A1L3JJ26_9FLAO|nr:hypothetical protein LPB136_07090 [Tenacibaculum todarodis]